MFLWHHVLDALDCMGAGTGSRLAPFVPLLLPLIPSGRLDIMQ